MVFTRWIVRWGDRVLATGTGPLPPEYGLPQPRLVHGDRAVVRQGDLSAEAVLAPRPPRPFFWGVPDLHFVKVLAMCLMTFAALVMLIRERVEELKLAKLVIIDETAEAKLLPARWSDGPAFRGSLKQGHPVPAAELARIKRFSSKVKALGDRETEVIHSAGLLAILGGRDEARLSNVFGPGGLGSGINNALGGLRGSALVGDERGIVGMVGGTVGIGGLGGGDAVGLGTLGRIGSGAGLRLSLDTGSTGAARVLRSATLAVRSCLGDFAGELTTTLDVRDGAVMSVAVGGADDDVKRCVSRRLEQLRFPGDDTITARWTTG